MSNTVLGAGRGVKLRAGTEERQSEPFSEQYDFIFGDYIERVKAKYSPCIGIFLIRFSSLEHALDIHLAEQIDCNSHHLGYLVIGGMALQGKIKLFRKLIQGRIREAHPRHAENLTTIAKGLDGARVFRNYVVHANWKTLENTGYVRTKLEEEAGAVIFKKVRITPTVINTWTRRVITLEEKLEEFIESIQPA